MQTEVVAPGTYLRVADIARGRSGKPSIFPFTGSTWWAWVKSGKAPAPIKLSPGCTVWRRADVIAFAESLAGGCEMNRPQTRRSPGSAGLQDCTANTTCPHDTASAHLPRDWRDRLPAPSGYYAERIAKLGRANGTGWAHGVCPFHDDQGQSLAVSITDARGVWRCPCCGTGDLVGFHRRMYGLAFKAAVRDLIGLGVQP